jgi:hypothetical protein
VRIARNVAIVMLLAGVVAFAPAGSNAAEVVLTLISIGFLAAISWTAFVFAGQNQLTLTALDSRRRAVLYGALGLIALLVAGGDELFATGIGTLVWIVLLAAAVVSIARIWTEASSY